MTEDLNGAWIFVSHSSRDWRKVREIRNILEDKGHNPLLFHLKCLEDEDEINELLKREIQARNWFVLCDSDNARSSKYVSNEIEFIKSLQDKVFEIIDLEKEIESQLSKLDRLSKRATIFISYSRKDEELTMKMVKILRDNDYQVLIDKEFLKPGDIFESQIKNAIENSIKNGFFIQIITENSLNSPYTRDEIQYALSIQNKMTIGANVIPISFINLDKLFGSLDSDGFSYSDINVVDFSEGLLVDNLDNLIRELKFKDMA
ncbi:toll/interleukin-1 receptor domain-containing protein [Algoriphagus sp. SE2]|uniref:toll/interleukin-1 receptor domain-containing protein n=1 Tax=Algoriphagus sp. SE2 TaxID=3141536 RepID=UPI0031CCE63A